MQRVLRLLHAVSLILPVFWGGSLDGVQRRSDAAPARKRELDERNTLPYSPRHKAPLPPEPSSPAGMPRQAACHAAAMTVAPREAQDREPAR